MAMTMQTMAMMGLAVTVTVNTEAMETVGTVVALHPMVSGAVPADSTDKTKLKAPNLLDLSVIEHGFVLFILYRLSLFLST